MILDLPLTRWSALARFLSDLGDLPPTIAAFRDERCGRLTEKPKAPASQHPTVAASTLFEKLGVAPERQCCTGRDIKTGKPCGYPAMPGRDYCGAHRPTVAITREKTAAPAKAVTKKPIGGTSGPWTALGLARAPRVNPPMPPLPESRPKPPPRPQPVPSAFQGPPAGEHPTSAPPKSDPSKPTLRSEVEKAQRFHNVRMDF